MLTSAPCGPQGKDSRENAYVCFDSYSCGSREENGNTCKQEASRGKEQSTHAKRKPTHAKRMEIPILTRVRRSSACKFVVALRLHADCDSNAAASKPFLPSLFSHRVCMEIAILRRLCGSGCSQACCRTASVWRLQFSGGCVKAIADKRVFAPRLHEHCDSNAAASKPLLASVLSHCVWMKMAILGRLCRSHCSQACYLTASAWRLQFSGGCVEAVANKRVVAPRPHGDCDFQAAASKPLLTSVLSHHVCMEIAILRRLRRSRCLQACCRTASVKRLQFSGGCVEAVASSVLLHRVCMRISILRRLRRSRF